MPIQLSDRIADPKQSAFPRTADVFVRFGGTWHRGMVRRLPGESLLTPNGVVTLRPMEYGVKVGRRIVVAHGSGMLSA